MERAAKDNSILTRNQVLATEKERAKLMSARKLKTPSLLIMVILQFCRALMSCIYFYF